MTDIERKQRYLFYKQKGFCHIDAVRRVIADERLPFLLE